MVKSELIQQLAEQKNIQVSHAEAVVSILFQSMAAALAGGDRVDIRGFGTFCVREYGAYTGRNPRSGGVVNILEKKAPFFKAGKGIADKIRAGS